MYKHLTSIKEEARRQLTHTQNRTPERNDQKGAAQHPEEKNKTRTGKQKKTKVEREITTLQYLG